MPLRANVKVETSTFYILFNQENKLILPLFQREFSWEEHDELEKFWDDIERTMPIQGQEHFIGQIVLGKYQPASPSANPLLKNFYNVIDGQQRITTATIFLCALRDIAIGNKNDEIAYEIQRYITTVSYDPVADDDFIVTLGYSDKEFLRNFIQFKLGDVRKKGIEDYVRLQSSGQLRVSNELIYDAYNFFKKKINEKISIYNDIQRANYFTRLKDCFLRDFFFIEVNLPGIDEGSQIFETMNAYGERLEAVDLLKNLIFMKRLSQGIPQSTLESEIIEWNDSISKLKNINPSRFLRHYWLSKYEDTTDRVTIENLYSTFRKKTDEEATFINQILGDIVEYSDIYLILNEPDNYIAFDGNSSTKKQVVDALNGLDAMNASRAFPLLMSTYKNFPEQFPKMCRLIEILVFKYSLICNLDAKRLESKFNDISVKFENVDKSNSSETSKLIEEKIKEIKNNKKRYL